MPYPPLAERFERLEEALQICDQMWDPNNNGPFEGKHYQLQETLCNPQPINKPKVLIGGSGERKTLRLVARYGDACFHCGGDFEELDHFPIPVSQGGPHALDNCRPSCTPCNQRSWKADAA